MDWHAFDTPAPLINMASRSLARLGDRRVKPLGFSIGQMPVLYLLRHGEAMPQARLAKLTKMEQPSMAQLLTRMERDGLIRRLPDPKDGRSSLISLTEQALAQLPAAREALAAESRKTYAGFSDDDLAMLITLLRRLNDNLDRMVAQDAGA